ncbi:hypothetical protein B0H19DRAFT_1134239 [Mycena capillaripes]|nr:hypothetical protein B0H19DRAFT_1134239 [Mycena capillaripes]
MGRNPYTSRKRNVVFFLAALLFLLAPDVLRSYPQTVAMGDAFSWAGNKFMQGLASGAFFFAVCFACWLVSDAYRWLTGASAETSSTPSPTHAELEDGTVSPMHELEVLEAEVAGAQPPIVPKSTSAFTPTTGGKLTALLVCGIFFEFYIYGVVSREKPLMENVSAALLYILRGWEVIFFAFVVLLLGAWVVKSRSAAAAAATPPVELLFEGILPEDELPTAKEFTESEKA